MSCNFFVYSIQFSVVLLDWEKVRREWKITIHTHTDTQPHMHTYIEKLLHTYLDTYSPINVITS